MSSVGADGQGYVKGAKPLSFAGYDAVTAEL